MNWHLRTKRKSDQLRRRIRKEADDLNKLMAEGMDSFHIVRWTFRDIAKTRNQRGFGTVVRRNQND